MCTFFYMKSNSENYTSLKNALFQKNRCRIKIEIIAGAGSALLF